MKTSEARKAEGHAQTELQKADLVVKGLKTDLSAARRDLTVLQLRLRAIEEKFERDQKHIENRFLMQLLSIDTAHQTAFEAQQADFEQKQSQFFVAICEKFKPFVDFSATISEESVYQILDHAANTIQNAADQSHRDRQLTAELADIGSIVGIGQNGSVVKAVTYLVAQARQFEMGREQLEGDRRQAADLLKQVKVEHAADKTSREWEAWSRRMHALITDNFTTPKTPAELQRSLEEAILSGIGQRPLKRQLEILGIEKGLFVRGALKTIIPRRPPSLATLVCVAATMHRLRRLAGYLTTPVSGGASPAPQRFGRARVFRL
jgi:hypothetical protein